MVEADLEQNSGHHQDRFDWLECLPVGQGSVFPALRLASLPLKAVQGLAEGKKEKSSAQSGSQTSQINIRIKTFFSH